MLLGCQPEMKKIEDPGMIKIGNRDIPVLKYETIATQNGELRFMSGTLDADMQDCPENFAFVIEDLTNDKRILEESWGFNGIPATFNVFNKVEYYYNSEIGENIYLHLTKSGCGSGFSRSTFKVKGWENGNTTLEEIFESSETSGIVFEPRTARIYVMTGLWEAGCHFGCDRYYQVEVYSMVHDNRRIQFKTSRKYPDVTENISPEDLLTSIKQMETGL